MMMFVALVSSVTAGSDVVHVTVKVSSSSSASSSIIVTFTHSISPFDELLVKVKLEEIVKSVPFRAANIQ